jgi:hypothetical protein
MASLDFGDQFQHLQEIFGSGPIGDGDPVVDGRVISHGFANDSLSVNYGPTIRRLVQREYNIRSVDLASQKSSGVFHLPIHRNASGQGAVTYGNSFDSPESWNLCDHFVGSLATLRGRSILVWAAAGKPTGEEAA